MGNTCQSGANEQENELGIYNFKKDVNINHKINKDTFKQRKERKVLR